MLGLPLGWWLVSGLSAVLARPWVLCGLVLQHIPSSRCRTQSNVAFLSRVGSVTLTAPTPG